MPGFKVVVSGDLADLKQKLDAVKVDLKTFKSQIDASMDSPAVARLNNDLATTEKIFKSIKAPSFSGEFANALARINASIEAAAEAALKAGPKFDTLGGRLPLDDFNKFRASVERLKRDLSQNTKINISGYIPRPIPPEVPASLDKTAKAARNAGSSITDVSRVVQDLPYGLIGITNNLNPMLESFQRLRAETGSSKAAFAALGQSLIGPAGIGLALAAVTSAFLIYQNGIAGFNKKTKEAKDSADEFIKTLRSAQAIQAESAASEEGNIAAVQALSAVVLDQSAAYETRNRALNELKDINKAYFGDLSLEQSQLGALTAAVNEYTNAIKAQAVLKGFTDELSRVSVEVAKQDGVLRSLKTRYEQAQAALSRQGQPLRDESGVVISAGYIKAEKALTAAKKAFEDQRNIVEQIATNYAELNGQIDAATAAMLRYKSTTSEGGKGREGDALKKQLEFYERILNTVTDINQRVEIGEKVLDLRVRLLMRDGPKQGITGSEMDATIRGFQDDFQKLLDEQARSLELSPTLKISDVLRVEIPSNISFFVTNSGTIATKVNDEVSKAVGLDKKIPVITLHQARVRLLGANVTAQIEGKEALEKNLSDAINQAIFDIKVESLASVGDILAGALTGGSEGFKNAARNFMSNIGGILSQLGKYVIATALKIQALKSTIEKFAIANPVLAIAAGVGLVALGATLKNITFGGPKLAEGGITTGPTIAQIGEAGREAIIPLNKLPQLIGRAGGGGINATVGIGIQGRQLVAWLEEERRSFNRNF